MASSQDLSTYLVLWKNFENATLHARRYGSGCEAGCDPVQISSGPYPSADARVVADGAGGFVGNWRISSYPTIVTQRLRPDGSLSGSLLEIDQEEGYVGAPDIGTDAHGRFLVVWHSDAFLGGFGINGRRLDSVGAPSGSQLTVSDERTPHAVWPRVSEGKAGGTFLVVYRGGYSYPPYFFWPGSDGSGSSIDGRVIRDGRPVGGSMTVNSYTTSDQERPVVARNSDGHYLVVWESFGTPSGEDLSGRAIVGRLFRDNLRIFADGFESGDPDAWSGSVGAD